VDELSVVHADDSLLVLNKPAGLLCVPGRGADKQDCLSLRAQQLYPDALVVHRLDMATSGLVVMARGAGVQRLLNDAFANRQVHKRYEAVVTGLLPPSPEVWGVIDAPIFLDWPNRPLRMISPLGKASVTRWQVLGQDLAHQTTRLALEPITGRSHQLRVHLQSIGHPIVGDALYGLPPNPDPSVRLQLHATWLALTHPITGLVITFCSPAPF